MLQQVAHRQHIIVDQPRSRSRPVPGLLHLVGNDPPGRLAHGHQHQAGDEETRQAGGDEDELPSAHLAEGQRDRLHVDHRRHQQPAEQHRQRRPRHLADMVERDRARQAFASEQIAHDRISGRPVHRLAATDDEPRREQLGEILREAAQHRADRPGEHAEPQDLLTAEAIDEARDRDTDQRIEQGERHADQQRQGRVADPEGALDVGREIGDDRDVELGAGRSQDEQKQAIIGTGDGARLRFPRGSPGRGRQDIVHTAPRVDTSHPAVSPMPAGEPVKPHPSRSLEHRSECTC